VGVAFEEEDEAAFEARMAELVEQLQQDFAESERLTAVVKRALEAVGYEI